MVIPQTKSKSKANQASLFFSQESTNIHSFQINSLPYWKNVTQKKIDKQPPLLAEQVREQISVLFWKHVYSLHPVVSSAWASSTSAGILLPSRFLEIEGSDKACESDIRAVIAGLGLLLLFLSPSTFAGT